MSKYPRQSMARHIGVGVSAIPAALICGLIAGASARVWLGVTEDQALVYLSLPVSLIILVITWKRLSQTTEDGRVQFNSPGTIEGPYRSSRLREFALKAKDYLSVLQIVALIAFAVIQGYGWLVNGEYVRFAVIFGLAGASLLLGFKSKWFLLGAVGAVLVAALWP